MTGYPTAATRAASTFITTAEIGTSRKTFESPGKAPEKLSLLRKYYYDTAAPFRASVGRRFTR